MIEKTATGRERPTHSPAKEDECPGNKGESPTPRRQRTDSSIFQLGGGQTYRYQTKPKQNQNHSAEETTAKKSSKEASPQKVPEWKKSPTGLQHPFLPELAVDPLGWPNGRG